MDKTINCNQPAFGHVALSERDGFHEPGLTKREYFIAMAMQGVLSNQDLAPITDFESAAKHAIKMADATINAMSAGEV